MSQKSSRQLTIRGIPPEVCRDLEKEAKNHGISMNKAILKKLIRRDEAKGEGRCAELLRFAGTWDEKRAEDFERHSEGFRTIERDLWV